MSKNKPASIKPRKPEDCGARDAGAEARVRVLREDHQHVQALDPAEHPQDRGREQLRRERAGGGGHGPLEPRERGLRAAGRGAQVPRRARAAGAQGAALPAAARPAPRAGGARRARLPHVRAGLPRDPQLLPHAAGRHQEELRQAQEAARRGRLGLPRHVLSLCGRAVNK